MPWDITESPVTHHGEDGSMVEVTFYLGADGVPVVQIDTRDATVRVNVNDGELATIHDGGERIVLPEHWTEYERSGPDAYLVLFSTPQAIRQHFEDDPNDPTQGLSDDDLREAGEAVVGSEALYDAWHDALVAALPAKDDE